MRDTRRALLALAEKMEPKLARAFVQAVNDIQSAAQIRLIAAAIEAGNVDDVFRILQIRPEIFAALDDAIRNIFLAGAAYQIDSVPGKLTDPSTGARWVIRFGGSQPQAQEIVRTLGAQLVTGIIETTREAIRRTVETGLQAGFGADRVALDLVGRIGPTGRREGGVVGLTSGHAALVEEVRAAFRSGDVEGMIRYLGGTFRSESGELKKYNGLKRRDRRYDAMVRRAIRGERMTAEQIETVTTRLADRYLALRGDAIARTETIPALNAGRREAVQQMIDRGIIRAWQVERIWDATGDARTRLDHLTMEGQSVEWGQPFQAPDGSLLMGPGDNSLGASPAQVINCRCYEQIRIDWIAGAT